MDGVYFYGAVRMMHNHKNQYQYCTGVRVLNKTSNLLQTLSGRSKPYF